MYYRFKRSFTWTVQARLTRSMTNRIFLKETGILVPIILIALPATEADQATFQFIPEDQAPNLHTQR